MKQIIWSREDRLDDDARESHQEFQRRCRMTTLTVKVMKNEARGVCFYLMTKPMVNFLEQSH